MECTALFDFNATAPDELTFRKSQKLLVSNLSDDKNWCRAECDGQVGLIPRNYVSFAEHSWYYGKTSRIRAEQILKNPSFPIGSFLIRDSENTPGGFSLSVKCGDGVQHYKILKQPGDGRFHIWDDASFPSLNALVTYHRNYSISRTQNVLLINIPQELEPFTVKAAFDFHRQEAGELEFRKGDVITVTECKDKNWWSGTLHGQVGIFPSNYVEVPPFIKNKFGI